MKDKYILIVVGIASFIANYGYQLFEAIPNYYVAFERTYFQIVILIVLAIVMPSETKNKKK